MNEYPKTLLEHPARTEGARGRANPRLPEDNLRFAERKLKEQGVTLQKQDLLKALNTDDDPIAKDAAWLHAHCRRALEILAKASPDDRHALREIWTHGFHAGERHEGITVNMRYLPTVHGRSAGNRSLAAGRKLSANKRRKITNAAYIKATSRWSTNKKRAEFIGVSVQALNKFERQRQNKK
jgi:hypothetical protein